MKSFATVALATLVSGALALPAAAYKFSPAGTSFTATGTATVTEPTGSSIDCNLAFTGATSSSGKAKITKVVVSAGESFYNSVTAGGLPWVATATGATSAKLTNVTFVTPLATLGPATVKFTDNASGDWDITNAKLPPGYKLSVAMTTTPAITIVP